MNQEQIKKILDQLANHERRLVQLEGSPGIGLVPSAKNKLRTLREVIRGKKFANGPEKVAAIVGYHEKVIGSLIKKNDLGKAWVGAKFDGTYKTNLLDDASGSYIRVRPNGECDLTQTGEDFFENLINNEPTSSTSK